MNVRWMSIYKTTSVHHALEVFVALRALVAYELVLGPVPPYQHFGLLLLDDYLYLFAQLLSQLPVPSLVVLQIL